jgi:hypothetical protein
MMLSGFMSRCTMPWPGMRERGRRLTIRRHPASVSFTFSDDVGERSLHAPITM